jgi:hypothetical protein
MPKLQIKRVAGTDGADLTPDSLAVTQGTYSREFIRAKEPFKVTEGEAEWLLRSGEFEPYEPPPKGKVAGDDDAKS